MKEEKIKSTAKGDSFCHNEGKEKKPIFVGHKNVDWQMVQDSYNHQQVFLSSDLQSDSCCCRLVSDQNYTMDLIHAVSSLLLSLAFQIHFNISSPDSMKLAVSIFTGHSLLPTSCNCSSNIWHFLVCLGLHAILSFISSSSSWGWRLALSRKIPVQVLLFPAPFRQIDLVTISSGIVMVAKVSGDSLF